MSECKCVTSVSVRYTYYELANSLATYMLDVVCAAVAAAAAAASICWPLLA